MSSPSEFKSFTDGWDFVETWVRVLDRKTDANRPLKEAAALFVISSLVGPKAVIPTDAGDIILNEWFLIIGPTGISRKSTVAKLARSYLNKVWSGRYSVPDVFTPEALIDELEANKGFLPWIMDEFAIILEMTKKKDYMASLTGDLQKLYDGEDIAWRTRTRGVIKVQKPYVTAFLCTTPFAVREKLITESMIHHGFLNRVLLIWDDGVENFVPMTDRMLSLEGLRERDPDEEMLLSWGAKLHRLDASIVLTATKSVLDSVKELEIALNEALKKIGEVERAIKARYITHLLKLSGLYRISRMTAEDLERCREGNKPVWIELEDLNRAAEFLKIVDKSFNRLLEEVRRAEVSKPRIENIEELVETVKKIVLTYGRREGDAYVIDRTELLKHWRRKTGADKDTLNRALAELEEEEQCESVKVQPKGPGRPKTLYRCRFT